MNNDEFKDIHFPAAGIDRSLAFDKQPNRPVFGGQYARTSFEVINVRGWEPVSGRLRGGQRAGLKRLIDSQVAGLEWIVQDMRLLVGTGFSPPGGNPVQGSNSGRVVTLVAVSQGNLFVVNPGDTEWTAPVNNSGEDPPLNFSGVMMSTQNNQKLWFVDGTNYVFYDPFTNSVEAWVALRGTLPQDEDGNFARLICTWRGRIVVSGLLKDPQNWFMSAVSDPTDWEYSGQDPDNIGVLSTTPTQAIAGNNAPQGLIGDVVTALIPYSDDILIFGGDGSIYMMRGDPMEGGQIDRVSDAIGIAWGEAWCKDPQGMVYFMSNRTGVYSFKPGSGGEPQRISQQIEQLLQVIDTGLNAVRMIWDDRFQGFHMFVTPLSEPGPTTHFFWEKRSNAWWLDRFANDLHNPLCCCTFDGNLPTDRIPLIGSWDGFVRTLDPEALDDDGTPIESSVIIGPFLTKNFDDVMLKEMQAVLGMNSGEVRYAVYTGATAELALASEPDVEGVWSEDRNLTDSVRRAGHAIYVKLTASSPWAMEAIRLKLSARGMVRMRGN